MPSKAATVTIDTVDTSGNVIFTLRNFTSRPICTSNAAIGTMEGESALRLRNSTGNAFPIAHDWFDEAGREIEKIVIAAESNASFLVNAYDDFSVEDEGSHEVSVNLAVWDCCSDVPAYTTYNHEEEWGPGYLKEAGVRFVESQPILITLSPEKNRH